MSAAVEARGICGEYGGLIAVDDLTFAVEQGQILGVLGPNGAGKTSAIRVLTTIFAPTRGTFAIAGVPHTRPADIRRQIGAEYLRYLPTIPAGRSVTITWRMQAVNTGSVGVFVAVLPQSGGPRPPVTGPTVHVSIARRKTLNSGGILPLALGMPLCSPLSWPGLEYGGARRTRHRSRC